MNPDNIDDGIGRRDFLKYTSSLPFLAQPSLFSSLDFTNPGTNMSAPTSKSIIGNYGEWAAGLLPEMPPLSFRNNRFKDIEAWRKEALAKVLDAVASPAKPAVPKVTVVKKYQYDGLDIEELSWQLPYGRPTHAVVLKPQGITKKLPAILALHDHAGMKYFGLRKIVKLSDEQHPILKEHQEADYSGKGWANEIAKKGYVVLVHDTFTFGSRRVHYEDVEGLTWGHVSIDGKSDADPEKSENVVAYNTWSSEHEHVMSKSLFCAGTTWPGVTLTEDQVALDILSARNDVDPTRIGCGGLSGGGLRTVYLAGLDKRIKCAVCVGFMTTWTDLILTKSFTHTWMTYAPIAKSLDFPEILGLRVPLPTLVLNNNQDNLFTLSEMKKADKVLGDVYKKAGAADKYKASFYDGPHKFDADMQKEAFAWFDKWI